MANQFNNFVTDLGQAAYLKMNGFKVLSRRGKAFYFEVMREYESEFARLQLEYLNSQFHEFDAAIMGLKKISPN